MNVRFLWKKPAVFGLIFIFNKKRFVIRSCLWFCTSVFAVTLSAQTTVSADTAILSAAVRNSVLQYEQFISAAAPLYSGPQYVDYDFQINEGHPFLLKPIFVTGSVMYDNILYENIELKYDLLRSKIVLKDVSGIFKITPDPDKVTYFTMDDHMFIKLDRDVNHVLLPSGNFYEVLYTGKDLTLLKRENKKIEESINPVGIPGLRRIVVQSNDFYIKKGNVYYSFNKKKQILIAFSDKKTEIRQYMGQKNIDLDNDRDNALTLIAAYYRSLTK